MKKQLWKKWAACGAALLVLSGSGMALAEEAKPIGMPNPIVTYASYQQAAKVLGFRPLTMTLDSGYTCDYISVIGKNTADLGFAKLGNTGTGYQPSVRVRTASKKAVTANDISGVYGAKWEKVRIHDVDVKIAQLKDPNIGQGSFAAVWETDKYLFSAQAENMQAAEFRSLLENSLIDDTVHYF